jgi:helicase required for RNAi-mediated heterochromatin assembly 1
MEAPLYVSSHPSIDLKATFYGSDKQYDMQNINILENWPSAPEESLDKTQWAAMQQILTKRLAIIQGPPGTGKTHVSKTALQVLIENKKEGDPPIIVAAQTNHALDQLLGHVAKFDPEYIRVGGQSNKPEIKKRALYEVRQRERLPIPPGGLLGKASKQMDTLARQMRETLSPLDESQTCCPFSASTLNALGVLNQAQAASLDAGATHWVTASNSASENEVSLWLGKALIPFQVVYKPDNFGFSEEEVDLEYEQITELQAEMGVIDDEDIENLRGPWCTVDDKFNAAKPSGTALKTAQETLSSTTDLWRIKDNLRGPIYSILQAKAKANILAKFREQAKTYEKLVHDLKVGKWERDAQYLERANIIGMTTTGLSKYRPLVSSLKPKIILIEEAAEVIEAPVAAACVESLEHLILVGDHQQLQGHCNVSELGNEPYYLNVSMFERLVRNNMPFKTLLRQRRMDPEFRRLLHPIYPHLQDHPDVVGRPPLPVGLGTLKSFFFNHEYPEYKDGQLSSFNDREAEFIAGFYHYLLQNSANPTGITILTFYNGQRKRILNHLKNRPLLAHHYTNVVTVDSYQGEENGIIILSLVRNNERGDIGFLKVDNRVCVALSRAQRGFYIFGNGKLLAASSPLWSKVIEIMGDNPNRMGDKFPIVCKKHGRQTLITYPEDWRSCDGGCDLKCSESLPCGHPCPLKCHSYPHDTVNCQQPCGKVLLCGHRCANICFEDPCFCSCEQSDKITRISREEPPDTGRPSEKQEVALGRGDASKTWTNATSVGGDQHDRTFCNKEVRGNNSQNSNGALPPPYESYSLPNECQRASYDNGTATKLFTALPMKDPTTHSAKDRNSLHTSSNSLCTPSTSPDFASRFGKGAQPSPEKPTQMVAHWTSFAAGGVKEDDSQREKLAKAEAKFALRQQLAETSLIEFDDAKDGDGKQHSGPVKRETVLEMKNGRKKWSHEYQPIYNAKPGFGDSTPPSIRSSVSAQSSGRQSLVDLLD